MAENFNLIFGSQAPTTASWSDADYQTGWNVVGSTPPTAEQFDALQNRADKKAQELNNRILPLEQKAEEQGRQASTAYTVGAAVTVDGLPADWLLVCTTAGTSGTVAITLPNPLLDGATINDGTITWTLRKIATNGSLGYRQPSTTYTAGQIAYHSALPTGWYLECTTGGTSGSGDLTISGTVIPTTTTITDGTVTWMVNAVQYSIQRTAYSITDCNSFLKPGVYAIGSATENIPTGVTYGWLMAFDYTARQTTYNSVAQILFATNKNAVYYRRNFHGTPSQFDDWKELASVSGVVDDYSMGITGYVKFGSLMGGLTVQWGNIAAVSGASYDVTYPITFATSVPKIFVSRCDSAGVANVDISANDNGSKSGFTYYFSARPVSNVYYGTWLAIGY